MTETEEITVDPVLERVKTGVEAFDDLVMGGLPRGRTTVVGGTPGSIFGAKRITTAHPAMACR